MGLDNIPMRWRADENGKDADEFTHGPDEPCPFHDLEQPHGIFGSCCWLRGKAAARELEALGRQDLFERMHTDMTPSEACAFGRELAAAAEALEQEHAGASEKPRGAGWNGTWNAKSKSWDWEVYSTFDEAIAAVRTASRWYQTAGNLGCGVHAWY